MSDHPYRSNAMPTEGSIDIRPLEHHCFHCQRWHAVGDQLDVALSDGTTCYAVERFEAATKLHELGGPLSKITIGE